jgi:hypothetical protein
MPDDKPEQTEGDELEHFEDEFNETLSGEPLDEDEPDDADQVVDSGDAGDEPTGEEEVVETPPTEPEPEPDTAPEPKLYTMPDDEKFGELRGKQATAAQLEEAGLLETLTTWGHQGLGFQQKLAALEPDVQRMREYEARVAAAEEARRTEPEPQKELTKEEIGQMSAGIQAHYLPAYEKAVENGAIEGELVEFAPKFLTSLEHRLQSGQEQLTLLFDAVFALTDDYVGRESGNIQDTGKNHLEGIMDEVSKVEGLQSFAVDRVREKFVDWYATDKNGRGYELMDTSLVTPGLMQDAFWAFARANPDLITIPDSTGTRAAPTNGDRKLASGGGSSSGATGGGAKPGGLEAELATFEDEFDEAGNQRY